MIQIRDFEHSPEAQESRKQELEKLIEDQGSMRSSLLQWCYNSYGEVFFFLFYFLFFIFYKMHLTYVCTTVAYLPICGPVFAQNLSNCCFELKCFSFAV